MAFGPLYSIKPFWHGNIFYRHRSQLWMSLNNWINPSIVSGMSLKTSDLTGKSPQSLCTHLTQKEGSMGCILTHEFSLGDGPIIYVDSRNSPKKFLSYVCTGFLKSFLSLSLKCWNIIFSRIVVRAYLSIDIIHYIFTAIFENKRKEIDK